MNLRYFFNKYKLCKKKKFVILFLNKRVTYVTIYLFQEVYLVNQEEIKLLNKMKKLGRESKCRFKIRKDRDYLQDLLDIGIIEERAWEEVLLLNKNFYFLDLKPNYFKNKNVLLFKKQINNKDVYIKLELEIIGNEKVVCWSFHNDNE